MNMRRRRYEGGIVQQRLRRAVGRAIENFAMVGPGDRVMVCVSGGKDSHSLLDILWRILQSAPFDFSIIAVLLDQGHPGFCADPVRAHFEKMGVDYRIEKEDTYSIVKRVVSPGNTYCGLCSRLRRGVLYRIAGEEGATKIALGHHADDIVETLFLNLFHGGVMKTMPPRLQSDDGAHTVIRPLAYCREQDLARYAAHRNFPIIPCNLCGSQQGARVQVKAMLQQWDKQHPGRVQNIFSAIGNVVPSHLMDTRLFDFTATAPLKYNQHKEGENYVIFR